MKENMYLNQDLSLLQFHERVLENAFEKRHPLFDRLMFLSIAGKNLDEYYMLKFPTIQSFLDNGIFVDDKGHDLNAVTEEITLRTQSFIERMNLAAEKILKELEKEKIFIRKITDLKKSEVTWLKKYFNLYIKPFLTPTILDSTHPFPLIPNETLNIIFKLERVDRSDFNYMIIMLPKHLTRFIRLSKDKLDFIFVEEVITFFADQLIPPDFVIKGFNIFKIIRDNNITFEEYINNMPINLGGILKKRKNGKVIKLFILKNNSLNMEKFFLYNFQIEPKDLLIVDKYIGIESFNQLISSDRKDLLYPALNARFPKRITNFNGNYFKAILEKDLLVHHPFETFDVFLGFLRQAAHDPKVVLIKQTLYRTSVDFQVVKELITAAENGKQVVALVEIRASMDEENNIHLSRLLEENGIQVVYGTLDYKTHAKICLVVRQNGQTIEKYLHLGTGNYHPYTAQVYTDFSLFTSNTAICNEANDVFNFITGFIHPVNQSRIFTSPLSIKHELLKLINLEIENKKNGKPAGIWFKCNGLVDKDIIDTLCLASQSGVSCDLLIRGICCLRPGIPGYSENIRVKSIVGRFLEHSRMFCFANGHEMPSLNNKVFISSADLMPKNLAYRIEVMAEIENPTVHAQLLQEIFLNYLRDTQNSWEMLSNSSYRKMSTVDDQAFDAHEYFITHESLSGQSRKF